MIPKYDLVHMLMEPASHSGCRCVPKNQVSTGPKYVKLNSSLHLTTISLADDHFGEAPFFLVNSGLVSMTLSLYWFIHVENSSIQPMMTVTPSPCLVFTSPNYSWGDHKNRFFPLSIGNCPSYFRRVTRKPVNQIPNFVG